MESSSSDNTYGEAIYDGGIPELYKIQIPIPIPLPCIGEAAARVSPGSSPARSEASRCAPCYAADAEPDPVPQVEASVGRNTQMLLAMDAMGGRSGYYGCRPASSYGSCAAGPICSPVSSRGGGGDDREPRAADDDASFGGGEDWRRHRGEGWLQQRGGRGQHCPS